MLNKGLFILFLLTGLHCFSQNKQILYNFNEIPQSLLLNPATEIQSKLYVGVPLLSGIHLNAGISGVTAYDLFAPDGVNFNNKVRDVIYRMGSNDVISSNVQIDIINVGFENKNPYNKVFYSFGIYQEVDFFMNWPRDPALLAYEGNINQIGEPFDLSHVAVEAEVLTVYHFGISKKIDKKLTVGARAKIYSSAYNINSTRNRGKFTTSLGTNNVYAHRIDADMQLQSSGFPLIEDIEEDDFEYDPVSHIKKSMFLGGNLGLGFDLGFTYHFSEKLTLTGSVLDVGFIRQSKSPQTYNFKGDYTFEGFEFVFPEVIDVGGQLNDYWQDLKDELEGMYNKDNNAYTTWRPIKFNSSIEYKFGKPYTEDCDCLFDDDVYMNAIGAHLYMISRPRAPQAALTVFYSRRLFNSLTAKATYTVDKFSFTNVGFGVSFNYGNFNFYTLADNLLGYQNLADTHSVSVQFGFNYMMQ